MRNCPEGSRKGRGCAKAALAMHWRLPQGNARSASRTPCLDSPLVLLGQVIQSGHRVRRHLSEFAALNPASASAENTISYLADSTDCARGIGPLFLTGRRRLSRAIRINVHGAAQSAQPRHVAAMPSASTTRTDRAARGRGPAAGPPRRTAIRARPRREWASLDARSDDLASCCPSAAACAVSSSTATVLESSTDRDSTAKPKTVSQPVARVAPPSAQFIRARRVLRCDALHGPPLPASPCTSNVTSEKRARHSFPDSRLCHCVVSDSVHCDGQR